MIVTLQEVINEELLSQKVIDCLPEKCSCGGDIAFTAVSTEDGDIEIRQMFCTNPMCYAKVAARLEAMAKAMKVDGWGEATCVEFCKAFKVRSPYQVFSLEERVANGTITYDVIPAFKKKVAAICDHDKRRVQLWEVVKYGSIPAIATISYKIFNGYDSLSDAFKDIEAGGVPFVAERLGLKSAISSEAGVLANKVYQTLLEYKSELLYGEKCFTIYKPDGKTVYFAITGSVIGYKNKAAFISYIASRYGGRINPMLMNSVTSQVDVLVVDGNTSSNKYRTAVRLNNKYLKSGLDSGDFMEDDIGEFENEGDLHPVGEKIFIGTSEDVISRLDEVYG